MTTRDPTPVTLRDSMQVAFLQLKGFTVIPWICVEESDLVEFEIQGDRDKIEDAIRAYGDPNEMVSIQEYILTLKAVKSSMYAMKRIGKK